MTNATTGMESMAGGQAVIQVGTEGGDVTLWGFPDEHGQWSFATVTDESTLAAFTDEFDQQALRSQSGRVRSFEAALAAFDRHPWHRMFPLEVHPAFRTAVWQAASERLQRDGDPFNSLASWRELCQI